MKSNELPTATPFAVVEYLLRGAVNKWEDVATECFNQIEPTLQQAVSDICDARFGMFKHSGLHQEIRYDQTELMLI
jgi:hypothetical protein